MTGLLLAGMAVLLVGLTIELSRLSRPTQTLAAKLPVGLVLPYITNCSDFVKKQLVPTGA